MFQRALVRAVQTAMFSAGAFSGSPQSHALELLPVPGLPGHKEQLFRRGAALWMRTRRLLLVAYSKLDHATCDVMCTASRGQAIAKHFTPQQLRHHSWAAGGPAGGLAPAWGPPALAGILHARSGFNMDVFSRDTPPSCIHKYSFFFYTRAAVSLIAFNAFLYWA
jgi:hypothetical protein